MHMTSDFTAIQELLCKSLCHDVKVVERFDGTPMINTPFRFPDGDAYSIYVASSPCGNLALSDRGHTLMHMSYDHDVDFFVNGTCGVHLKSIMAESGLHWDGGAFRLDTSPDKLSEAVIVFGQALTRIYGLTLLSPSNTGSPVRRSVDSVKLPA